MAGAQAQAAQQKQSQAGSVERNAEFSGEYRIDGRHHGHGPDDGHAHRDAQRGGDGKTGLSKDCGQAEHERRHESEQEVMPDGLSPRRLRGRISPFPRKGYHPDDNQQGPQVNRSLGRSPKTSTAMITVMSGEEPMMEEERDNPILLKLE